MVARVGTLDRLSSQLPHRRHPLLLLLHPPLKWQSEYLSAVVYRMRFDLVGAKGWRLLSRRLDLGLGYHGGFEASTGGMMEMNESVSMLWSLRLELLSAWEDVDDD